MTTKIERYITGSGQGLVWANAISPSTINSLGGGSCVLSDIQIDNSLVLDMFADVSMVLGSQTWTASSLGVHLYPLNQDGSTYGDGRFTVAAGSGTPGGEYFVGSIPIIASGASITQKGLVRGILIPPGKFKFVFCTTTNTLAASGNQVLYRTYNRQVS